jgi:hypothetical protein
MSRDEDHTIPAVGDFLDADGNPIVDDDPGKLAPHAYGRKYGVIKPHNLAVAIAACLPRSNSDA